MKVTKISHIGVAVKRIEDWMNFYTKVLGLENQGIETLDIQKLKLAFFRIGDSAIELLEPLDDSSTIAKFINKQGEGLHHIAIEVKDIHEAINQCKQLGMKLVDETPRSGAHGNLIAFLHPKSTGGVLLELCQVQG